VLQEIRLFEKKTKEKKTVREEKKKKKKKKKVRAEFLDKLQQSQEQACTAKLEKKTKKMNKEKKKGKFKRTIVGLEFDLQKVVENSILLQQPRARRQHIIVGISCTARTASARRARCCCGRRHQHNCTHR
jgi:hypothetical protein